MPQFSFTERYQKLRGWTGIVLIVIASRFFNLFIHHLSAFLSGASPSRGISYDPRFFLYFLAMHLLVTALGVKIFAKDALFTENSKLVHAVTVAFVVLSVVGYVASLYFKLETIWQIRALSTGILAYFFEAAFFESRKGVLSGILAIGGIGVLFLGALSPIIMEALFLTGLSSDWMADYLVASRANHFIFFLGQSFQIGLVAADLLLALWKGRSVLTFRLDFSYLPELFGSRYRRFKVYEKFFIYYLFLLVVVGQAFLCRHFLLAFFGGYPLDFINLNFLGIGVPYLLLVLLGHYFWSRHLKNQKINNDLNYTKPY